MQCALFCAVCFSVQRVNVQRFSVQYTVMDCIVKPFTNLQM